MKKIFLFCFLAMTFAASLSGATTVNQSSSDLQTVSFVDPLQYVGRWYQISHNQLAFEPNNCMCAQQTLGINPNGTVSVYNSCTQDSPNGKMNEIRGFAVNDDPQTNSKFTVDFGLPHKGKYWIIGLAQDYSWAVVSDPSRLSLYILSKTPFMSPESYQKALSEAALQVDTSKLKITDQKDCVYPL
jgi:apolipoprotein D and lipocalin family protein